MTAKYVAVGDTVKEPWLRLVIPSKAVNCSMLIICCLHPFHLHSPLGEGAPLHYLCNPLLGCRSVYAE